MTDFLLHTRSRYFSVDIESFPGLETWVEAGTPNSSLENV